MVKTFSTLRPRGRPFVKGQPKSAGRKKGALNLHTRAIREMIAAAAEGLGGTARLTAWAMEEPQNERLFWSSIWPRILPLQIRGTGAHGEIELSFSVKREELPKELEQEGLPMRVFSTHRPLLELEPQRITNGNGHDPDGDGGGGGGAMGGA